MTLIIITYKLRGQALEGYKYHAKHSVSRFTLCMVLVLALVSLMRSICHAGLYGTDLISIALFP